jgi:hypothetical protein
MLGEILLLGLGVMISPFSITLVIFLILQRRGVSTPAVFVAGRVAGVFIVLFSVLAFFHNLDFSPESTSSHVSAAVKVAIGALLLLFALLFALSKSDSEDRGWLRRRLGSMERLSLPAAAGLGFALSIISPRCLFLTLAAAATILHANMGATGDVLGLVLFIIIANLAVLAPLIIYITSPEKSSPILESMRGWLTRHQRALVLSILLVLGTYLVIRGTLDLL